MPFWFHFLMFASVVLVGILVNRFTGASSVRVVGYTLVGLLLLVLVQAGLAMLQQRDTPATQSAPSPAVTDASPATTTTSPSDIPTPPTSVPQPVVADPADPTSSPTVLLDSLRVEVGLSKVSVGRRVGDEEYQLSEWGPGREVHLSYGWEGRAGVAKVEGEFCAIVPRMTGPGYDELGDRSAACSARLGSPDTVFSLTKPGAYTLTVTDGKSKVIGRKTVTVVP
ncbi:hypothetical protein GGG17_05140 [Arsenicicoccus sp. MKL-02]|uniref:Uncharacterized protein n=1 Tax=Arsenicicoccus cauae TaxID=2663847 RepID=A0A6I3IFA3_9MICO|nr:hypothetical protein [Arsenicicoccus cauae]MTB71363.1 hypothetical protein [Arsenicicoccus cauae]